MGGCSSASIHCQNDMEVVMVKQNINSIFRSSSRVTAHLPLLKDTRSSNGTASVRQWPLSSKRNFVRLAFVAVMAVFVFYTGFVDQSARASSGGSGMQGD